VLSDKSTGDRGLPQGSPLSPLLSNLALDDLDHALDRGCDTITYARYLDDSALRRRGKGAVMAI
jgi:RNA-directed DNA polymerase